MKRIYFVRHGETEGNIGGFWQGPQQSLNATGFVQADKVAVRAKGLVLDTLFVSTMTRAQQTAQAIAQTTGLEPQSNDLFREIKDPTSVMSDSVATANHEGITNFCNERTLNINDPAWYFEDEENQFDFKARILGAMKFLSTQPGSDIMVVSHGHFIRSLAGIVATGGDCDGEEMRQFATRFKTTNTGITCFYNEGDNWQMLTWNDHAHFAE